MTKHDESRRTFLVGAVAGAAAGASAVAAASLVPGSEARPLSQPGVDPLAPAARQGAFLNEADAATIAAFAERLMPGAPGKPGATDANVLNYIDLALAGAYADQQDFYRHGLAALEAHCRKAYGETFAKLSPDQQDETIRALEEGKADTFTWPQARAFFDTMRTHTMEGMFADPIYGGNKDFAGWQLVGFPGVQLIYTANELESRQAFTTAPIAGLQSKARDRSA
jgi:gluconate 2-dehydrogenase subunit 3-like protein